jgi:hypothetical protein
MLVGQIVTELNIKGLKRILFSRTLNVIEFTLRKIYRCHTQKAILLS